MQNVVIAAAVLAVAVAVPLLVAQDGGNQAAGWETRLDRGTDANSVLHFRTMGTGVHATTGGRGGAIFWQPNSMAKGDYTISAMFVQTEPSGHPNAYAILLNIRRIAADSPEGPNPQEESQFVRSRERAGRVPPSTEAHELAILETPRQRSGC